MSRRVKRKGGETTVISISLPMNYVEAIDVLVKRKIYYSRSDLVREAIRNLLSSRFPHLLENI